jgi:hypothetical protein
VILTCNNQFRKEETPEVLKHYKIPLIAGMGYNLLRMYCLKQNTFGQKINKI